VLPEDSQHTIRLETLSDEIAVEATEFLLVDGPIDDAETPG
jgi:hypothetical protein